MTLLIEPVSGARSADVWTCGAAFKDGAVAVVGAAACRVGGTKAPSRSAARAIRHNTRWALTHNHSMHCDLESSGLWLMTLTDLLPLRREAGQETFTTAVVKRSMCCFRNGVFASSVLRKTSKFQQSCKSRKAARDPRMHRCLGFPVS